MRYLSVEIREGHFKLMTFSRLQGSAAIFIESESGREYQTSVNHELAIFIGRLLSDSFTEELIIYKHNNKLNYNRRI